MTTLQIIETRIVCDKCGNSCDARWEEDHDSLNDHVVRRRLVGLGADFVSIDKGQMTGPDIVCVRCDTLPDNACART